MADDDLDIFDKALIPAGAVVGGIAGRAIGKRLGPKFTRARINRRSREFSEWEEDFYKRNGRYPSERDIATRGYRDTKWDFRKSARQGAAAGTVVGGIVGGGAGAVAATRRKKT